MALDKQVLAAQLYQSVTNAVGENVPSATRWPLCQAIAGTIIDYITTYAEVIVPEHDPRMTSPAGAFVGPNFVIPDHRHESLSLTHLPGRIK